MIKSVIIIITEKTMIRFRRFSFFSISFILQAKVFGMKDRTSGSKKSYETSQIKLDFFPIRDILPKRRVLLSQ